MASFLRPIAFDTHRDKGWRAHQDFRFAASNPVIALSALEVGIAALSLPLAFLNSADGISLGAVLGLSGEQNLFVAPDGKWARGYVPAALRTYPFKLAKLDDGKLTLCFDEGSGLLVEASEGVPFFNEEGEPAVRTQKMLGLLVEVARGQEALAAASNLLHKHGVLEPWPLKVKDGENEREVGGLRKVNEAKLNELNDEGFLELRRGGALPLAYAQLLSMQNISVLGKLAQAHATYQQRQALTEAERKSMFQASGSEDGAIDWNRIFNE